jgi:hypothetical protein
MSNEENRLLFNLAGTASSTITGWIIPYNGYKVQYAAVVGPGVTACGMTDGTSSEAACIIAAGFKLATTSNPAQWVAKSNTIPTNNYPLVFPHTGIVRLMQNVNAMTSGLVYGLPVNANGNWVSFYRIYVSGTADQVTYALHGCGPIAMGAYGSLGVPNSWVQGFQIYSGGAANNIGWATAGGAAAFGSANPVSINSAHILHVLNSWNASNKNMHTVLYDTAAGTVYSHDATTDLAAAFGGASLSSAWIQFGAGTGGLNMIVDLYGYKFVGPTQTVDFTMGFYGAVLPG